MAKVIDTYVIEYEADTTGATSAQNSLNTSNKNLLSSYAKLATGIAVAAVAFKAAYDASNKALAAYGKQETAVKKLNLAYGTASSDLIDFASEMQSITTVGDGVTIELLSLGKAMGLTAEESETATKEAISLSNALGIDLKQAMQISARAADGNYESLNELAPQIRNVNDEAGKQSEYAKLVAVGWEQATLAVSTHEGVQLQLNNAIGDTWEVAGDLIDNVLGPMKQRTLELVTALNSWLMKHNEIVNVIGGTSIGTLSQQSDAVSSLKAEYIEATTALDEMNKAGLFNIDIILRAETATENYNKGLGLMHEAYRKILSEEAIVIEAERELADARDEATEATEKANAASVESIKLLTEYNGSLKTMYERKLEDLGVTDDIAKAELEYTRALQDLEVQLKNSNITFAERIDLIIAIGGYYEAYIKTLEDVSSVEEKHATDWAKMQEDSYKRVMDAQNEWEKEQERIATEESERQQERIANTMAFVNQIQSAWTAFGDVFSNLSDARISKYESEMNYLLANQSLSEAERLSIQKEYGAKITAEKKKQARLDKAIAISSAIIDTASAIIGFLAKPGGFVGIGLSIAAGITGAAQIAAIASTPSYATGTPDQGYIVPPGYEDDSFPVSAKSGETVTVGKDGADSGNVYIEFVLDGVKVGRAMTTLVRDRKITIREGDVA